MSFGVMGAPQNSSRWSYQGGPWQWKPESQSAQSSPAVGAARPGQAQSQQSPYATSTPYGGGSMAQSQSSSRQVTPARQQSTYAAYSPQQATSAASQRQATPQQTVSPAVGAAQSQAQMQSQAATQGGGFQDLFQQYNFTPPAGFIDALIGRLQGNAPPVNQSQPGGQPAGFWVQTADTSGPNGGPSVVSWMPSGEPADGQQGGRPSQEANDTMRRHKEFLVNPRYSAADMRQLLRGHVGAQKAAEIMAAAPKRDVYEGDDYRQVMQMVRDSQPQFSAEQIEAANRPTPPTTGQQGGSIRPGQANPAQDPYATSTPYGGEQEPEISDLDRRTQELYEQYTAGMNTAGMHPGVAAMRFDSAMQRARNQAESEFRQPRRGGAQRSPQELAAERDMADTWEYVQSLSEEEQRRMSEDPEAMQMLEELTTWRRTGQLPATRQQTTPPPIDPSANRPQGTAANTPQATGQYATTSSASQGFMPPPPSGFDQFGTPAAQQQMYNNSMMAWTMPKQQLLSWGQQASAMPWGANYGNMSADQRPMPYEVQYGNPFGQGPQQISQNRDAFIQAILNQQANQFVGTYAGPGNPGPGYGRQPYDPSRLMSQAQQILAGGWQNPFGPG